MIGKKNRKLQSGLLFLEKLVSKAAWVKYLCPAESRQQHKNHNLVFLGFPWTGDSVGGFGGTPPKVALVPQSQSFAPPPLQAPNPSPAAPELCCEPGAPEQ